MVNNSFASMNIHQALRLENFFMLNLAEHEIYLAHKC